MSSLRRAGAFEPRELPGRHADAVNRRRPERLGRTCISGWGREPGGDNVHIVGVYTDRLVETAAGWRFAERRYDLFHRNRTPAAGRFYELPEPS